MTTSSVQLNEPVLRIIALEVALLTIAFAVTQVLVIPLFLLLDFYLRGWDMQRYSPLRWIALQINHFALGNRQKPVFSHPHIFAARMGAMMNFLIILGWVLGYEYGSLGLAVLVIAASLLQSLAGICVGTSVYNYFQKVRHHFHV